MCGPPSLVQFVSNVKEEEEVLQERPRQDDAASCCGALEPVQPPIAGGAQGCTKWERLQSQRQYHQQQPFGEQQLEEEAMREQQEWERLVEEQRALKIQEEEQRQQLKATHREWNRLIVQRALLKWELLQAAVRKADTKQQQQQQLTLQLLQLFVTGRQQELKQQQHQQQRQRQPLGTMLQQHYNNPRKLTQKQVQQRQHALMAAQAALRRKRQSPVKGDCSRSSTMHSSSTKTTKLWEERMAARLSGCWPLYFCRPEVRLACVADACHPISKLTSFTGERFTKPGERIWVFGAPYPVAVWTGPPIKKGELRILGIRTGEFLTPAEGAEAAKALQPTGQYDCIRTCDIYPDASTATGQWREKVRGALRLSGVSWHSREDEFAAKRFSRGCSELESGIVPFVAVPFKGLEFSSIRRACPLAFVQHTGERLRGCEALRGPWVKWHGQRQTVSVHQVLLNGFPLYVYTNNPQEVVHTGDELCLNMLQFPGFLTDTFLATLGLIKRRRANAESVLENFRLQGYTSPMWLQRSLLLRYPLNYEDICSRGSLETVRLLELVSAHNAEGPRSVALSSRMGLNNGPAPRDAHSALSSRAGLACFMQWRVPHESRSREEIQFLLSGEASLPLCNCLASVKLRKVALRLLHLPEAYANLPPHELGPLLESHWVVVEGALKEEEGSSVLQRLVRARDCCRQCYKTHPVALAFPNMGWRHSQKVQVPTSRKKS
ncbi:hypothetical protein cyc_04056 [Cyclospora cayetanensis]|uniref:Uncharacterized protein n=1 Tax=Cyclospora cayetanensis TaxID=88456 RepID=A0A1D3D574_9EIME|nr:hypothetical protein cyc_04056 [Cyclospora cayetanensis]